MHGLRVGLTGGIGSGKSVVASFLASLGALVIDADVLARDVVALGTPGYAAIVERFPAAVRSDASIDRAALARIVFSDPAALADLNAITHPLVRARAAELEAASAAGTIAVHVVPLLFEGDYWKQCDRTVLVTAPRDVRLARVVGRDGLAAEDVEARMAAQIDPEEARRRADIVIENDGDLGALRERTRAVYEALLSEARPTP